MKYITIILGVVLATGIFAYFALDAESPSEVEENTLPESEDENEVPADIQAHIAEKADLIRVDNLKPFDVTGSPLTVTGEARGYWYFEASFPVIVTDWDGKIIGEGYATAEGDWMTESFVPFSATVAYTLEEDSYSNKGTLLLKKSNASGLPEHDDALEIPITLTKQ